MRLPKLLIVVAAICLTSSAVAQQMTELSCNDFRPTTEAIERFPDLVGACEGIVDRDGDLYAKFTAVVRRVSGNSVTLFLPATKHTFNVRPEPSQEVLVEGRKTRVRDLVRGQEVHIYLAANAFSKPEIEEVAFITEQDFIVDVPVEQVAAFPTAEVQAETVQKPGKVVTTTVRTTAIVEAVNKETREPKLINANGERFSIVADETVRNFDQIEAKDRIVTEYLESVIVLAVPAGTPMLGSAAVVELAPLGAKPGITGAKTFVIEATVEALNVSDRIATVRYEDGTTRTIKVADDVALDLVAIGDAVRLRVTQAVAISVRKADKS